MGWAAGGETEWVGGPAQELPGLGFGRGEGQAHCGGTGFHGDADAGNSGEKSKIGATLLWTQLALSYRFFFPSLCLCLPLL